MTATETLVSSRLMKTDDSPQEAAKRNKKQDDEQTGKYQTKKFRTKFKSLSKNNNTVVLLFPPLYLFLCS